MKVTTTVIKEITEKYGNCVYFNMFEDNSFVDEDFYDGDHLNELETEKFSKIIYQKIEKLNGKSTLLGNSNQWTDSHTTNCMWFTIQYMLSTSNKKTITVEQGRGDFRHAAEKYLTIEVAVIATTEKDHYPENFVVSTYTTIIAPAINIELNEVRVAFRLLLTSILTQ